MALPAGSLQNATIELLNKAGFKISVEDRSYFPSIDDSEIECMLLRAQEIPRYVEQGKFDIGITGKDWIVENKASVLEVCELKYSKKGFNAVRLVIAVPESSSIKSVEDLTGKTIATELVNVTREYLERNSIEANVEYSWGATESKPPYLVDAIAELVDSGASLRANKLKVLATIMESTTRIIVNKTSFDDPWKQRKIEEFSLLLKSVLDAEGMVGLKFNISKSQAIKALGFLPSLRRPTISDIAENGWCSIDSIISKNKIKEVVPIIRNNGGEGIVEYSCNKIIY